MTTLTTALPGLVSHAKGRLQSRPSRVMFLLSLVVLLSMADLYLTILFVRDGGGFPEANPVARAIMQLQSIPLLIGWKLSSVITTVGILYLIRRTRSAEIGAWVCFLVLGWLTIHWGQYVAEAHPTTLTQAMDYGYSDPHWVSISSP